MFSAEAEEAVKVRSIDPDVLQLKVVMHKYSLSLLLAWI